MSHQPASGSRAGGSPVDRLRAQAEPGSPRRVELDGRRASGPSLPSSPGSPLASLVERLTQRADLAEREGATGPIANIYRVVVGELRALLDGAAPTETSAPVAAQLLSAGELARALKVSRKWVYRHAARLPFTRRVGRAVRFDSRGLESWLVRLR